MRALRAHHRGGPETLVYEEASGPGVLAGEALVRVHAAGITFAELSWDLTWQTREGIDRTPIIPAHEVSGVVVELDDPDGVIHVGDHVFGLIDFDRDGAAADYVAVPVSHLAIAPRSVSPIEAASLPLAALTAWQALVDHARVERGEEVLVRGAAGGVGVYVVQLARILGARVTGMAARRDVDLVLSLGAERVIDDMLSGLDGCPSTFDVAIDTVGGETVEPSFRVIRLGGRLVTLDKPASEDLAYAFGVDAIFFVVCPDWHQLSHLAALVDQGELRPVVSQTFSLAEGRQAYASAALPRPPGKTVLIVAQ